MKKLWTGFQIIMLLPVTAVSAGVVLASSGLSIMGMVLIFGGAAAAGWWYLYFKKLYYVDNSREIHVHSGLFIKKKQVLVQRKYFMDKRRQAVRQSRSYRSAYGRRKRGDFRGSGVFGITHLNQ